MKQLKNVSSLESNGFQRLCPAGGATVLLSTNANLNKSMPNVGLLFFVTACPACALKFLHEKNISHLDLKPQNILLSGNVLKLAGTQDMKLQTSTIQAAD